MYRIKIEKTAEGNRIAHLIGADIDNVRIVAEDGRFCADDTDGHTGETHWASKAGAAARKWAKAAGYRVSAANTTETKDPRSRYIKD